MRILIACDIHGLTPAVRQLFAPLGEALIFLSPWDGEGCPYASEAEAVQVFHAQDGLRRYGEKIARTVQGEAVFLVGLSVGASSVWQYLPALPAHRAARLCCITAHASGTSAPCARTRVRRS